MEPKEYPKPEIPPKEYWEDDKWADENYMELVKEYPNMWVTVVNKRVVRAGHNPREIVDKTESETGRKEFPIIFVEKGVHVYFPYFFNTKVYLGRNLV